MRELLVNLYKQRRGRRFFRRWTVRERAGKFLAAAESANGAINLALVEDDINAAVFIALHLLPNVEASPYHPPQPISGTIETKEPPPQMQERLLTESSA